MDAPATDASERMAQVVKPHSFEPGGLADSGPRLFQIGLRLAELRAWNDIRIAFDAWQTDKHFERRCTQVDGLASGFRVDEEDHASFDIHMLPFGVEDFTHARAGQDQEPDRRDGMGVRQRAPVALFWCMLRARLFGVDEIWQADGFAFHKRSAEPPKLFAGKESLSPTFGISFDPDARVCARGHFVALCRPIPDRRDKRQRPIRLIGYVNREYVDLERGVIFLADSKTGRKPVYLSAAAQSVLASIPRVSVNPHIIAGEREGAPRADLKKPWPAHPTFKRHPRDRPEAYH